MAFRFVLSVAAVLVAASLIILCLVGCLRSDGRNSDCRWPGESPTRPASAWHVSEDAEFAEDLSIRYADVHYGLRTPHFVSGEAYDAARDSCMATLFAEVAREHQVSVQDVYSALGRNRVYIDLIGIVPFILVYCFVVAAFAWVVWRRYPPVEDGWVPGIVMFLMLSFAFAVGGVMLGEVWSWIVERYRVGNPHMSYRAQRLIWSRHPMALFTGAIIIFWIAVLASARRLRPARVNLGSREILDHSTS
jgi:hypothetical protein